MERIKKFLIIMSGKGGVGKSTVSTLLTLALANAGKKVGILDLDLCGPSIGLMFNIKGEKISATEQGWEPIEVNPENPIKLISIAFVLKDENQAIIWRGPKKNSMITKFLTEVNWGNLDYLVIDTPPGISDEHITLVSLLNSNNVNSSAVIVTTPQMISINDVRKEMAFCEKADLRMEGIIENMSGLICPHCSTTNNIFSKGGGKALSELTKVPFLGSLSIDPNLSESLDYGKNYIKEFQNNLNVECINDIIKKIDA